MNATPKERAARDHNPAREHLLVWTHQDGRPSRLIGTTAGEVVGTEQDEGRTLPYEQASSRLMHSTSLAGEEAIA
ncbi:hypothetical protein [Streptomyces sp. BH105]|uniref:hypothetical protein n=1 Tax=Streptomyces sp. BH105 TaxID=3410408 RepID=UPI003CEF5816